MAELECAPLHGQAVALASISPTLSRKSADSVGDVDVDVDSDTEDTGTFEDAPDIAPVNASTRSVTQRSVPRPKLTSSASEIPQVEKENDPTNNDTIEPKLQDKTPPEDNYEPEQPTIVETDPEPGLEIGAQAERNSATKAKGDDSADRIEKGPMTEDDELTLTHQNLPGQSKGQPDIFSLDDETPAYEQRGSPTRQLFYQKLAWLTGQNPEEHEMKMSANEAQPEPPKKTISLSSIASSLPAMPWSPGAQPQYSPTKNLDAAHAPPAPAPAAPISPGAAPATNGTPTTTVPPQRKLAGAFSWLSRNSSKDLTNVSPPFISPRSTVASSTAMLISKFDTMGTTGNGNVRNSLKDRFKAMRMREEADIKNLPGDGNHNGVASLVNQGLIGPVVTSVAEQTENGAVQPRPAHVTLDVETASGAAAEPPTLCDQPVDWDLWQSVVYEGPAAVAKTSPEELNKAIASGIPSAIRGVIWQVLAQSQSQELEAVYRDLVARGTEKETHRQSNGSLAAGSNGGSVKDTESSASSVHSGDAGSNGAPSLLSTDLPRDDDDLRKRKKDDFTMIQKLEKIIRKDIGARTAYSKFVAAQDLQEGLYGVCKAYALYDEEVGYAQGMNFLIMPLLFNMSEEEAFCLLVRLMNNYFLRDLFVPDMPGLHMHLYQFERLLEDTEPALYCHLRRRGISPHLYATQWFLTLFSYRFPLQLVLRIYDLILSEGLSAILKFGIVLMQRNSPKLLSMTDMSHLTNYLRDRLFDVYIESAPSANSILENGFFGSSTSSMDKEVYRADELVHDACEVKVTPDILAAYRLEWEDKMREEKEKQAEIETLRSQNTSFASKIRKLEERLQAVDREQADLATELVHTKVENQELKDQNESLTGQVRELKIVIEKQPVEIEDQWKLERDALMERNLRVYEENQTLEKDMAELEEQLVRTKVQYAEINSQHETLLRKWNDLKRTFA